MLTTTHGTVIVLPARLPDGDQVTFDAREGASS